MRIRRLSALLAGLVAVSCGAAFGASRDWSGDASMLVDVQAGSSPGLSLQLDFADRPPPGRVTVYVPRGFDVYPERPLAYPVGVAEIDAGNASFGSFSDARFVGQISAVGTDSPLAAAARACAPGDPIALWKLSLTLLGQPVDVPIAIDPPQSGDPPDSGLRIDFCPPPVPAPAQSTAPLLPMQALGLVLSYVPPPGAPGSYVWHAVVTPVSPDGRTLSAAQAYELRSTFAVPHLLTLLGRIAKDGRAVLSGRLTAAGRPLAHAAVEVTRLVRKVVRGRVEFLDSFAGERTTNSKGAYSLRVALPSTSGFVAATYESYDRCTAPLFAPAGCVSATMPGTVSQPITLSVSKPRK